MLANLMKNGCIEAAECIGEFMENDISDGIG